MAIENKRGPWSKAEKKFIADNAARMGYKEIAIALQRNPQAVAKYIRENHASSFTEKAKGAEYNIQQSPVWTAELMAKISAVRSGKLSSWERAGNAYCLNIYPQYVVIEDDYSEAPDAVMKIPIAIFSDAVNAWQAMIDRRHSDDQ